VRAGPFPTGSPTRSAGVRWLPFLAHLPVVAWIFAGPIFAGRVPFFRDVALYYYPNYVFLERSLAQRVWPLWNPDCDAGAPFLTTDAVDLVLVGTLGAERALRLGPPLHMLLAMVGMSLLARRLGFGPWGHWSAGLFYGLSGYVLSSVNLFELFHAAAWAPLVLTAALRLWTSPDARGVAGFALAAAAQVATLGAETILQTGLLGLSLFPVRPDRRRSLGLAAGLVATLLLSAPALLGIRALVEGTRRGQGLNREESFAWSVRPIVLLDSVLPGFFGDVHTFSEAGYWGQPFFPDGFPYMLSLYVGPGLVLLAAHAGPFAARKRLWAILLLGLLLALGTHGPLAALLEPLMRHFRSPPKLLFMSTVALCLLAARGLDDASRARRSALTALVVGAGLLLLSAVLTRWPDAPARTFGGVVPELLDARARFVTSTAWPARFGTTGALLLGAALVLRSSRRRPLAGVLIGLDLLLVNGDLNTSTGPEFYRLRPEVRALVDGARAEGPYRWFSYGAAGTPELAWAPEVAHRNSDVWLYYMDRQSLTPRTHVLDGLQGAFDEDRVGWAPTGSTLAAGERLPARYREHHARLRMASVRWVLSFRPLPEDLVRFHDEVVLPEIREPLRLYEIQDPLPRAFWVGRYETLSSPEERERRLAAPDFDPRSTVLLEKDPPALAPPPDAATPPSIDVSQERVDPHTVRLRVKAPPGYLVVAEGYHRDWHAEVDGRERPLLAANGRYWALPTAGGDVRVTVTYRPLWRTWALACLGVGLALVLVLSARPSVRRA
jgi:hypothetical protein